MHTRIKENVVIERSKMINEAPTMAKMLKLTMENIDGEVIEEIMK